MAINWDRLKALYLQTDRATQLASLALNLTRIQTLATHQIESSTAHHLVRESQFFIEWTVPTLNLETDFTLATELVDLQRQLSQWKLHWTEVWETERERQQLVDQAQTWCERLRDQYALIAI